MHASSLENMQRCFERYVLTHPWEESRRPKVLDVGGADVNGSYADIFNQDPFEYTAMDIEGGPGVHIVLEDPHRFPLGDNSVDVLISGQTFEHVEFFWLLFQEMVRVLSPDGLLILIAPSAGPIHRYPVDCYRFYPDAYRALAKYADCEVIDIWRDDRGPWHDLVGVFAKVPVKQYDPSHPVSRPSGWAKNRYELATMPSINFPTGPGPEPEVNPRETEAYVPFLGRMHAALSPDFYLEIGVRRGVSLAQAACPSLAIDPLPELNVPPRDDQRVIAQTSDHFFEFSASKLLADVAVDLAFIDGMHLFEFVLRDFMNVERHAHEHTVVVIDDVFPVHPVHAARRRTTAAWTGDVWKIYDCLSQSRPDLALVPIDTSPSGLLVVFGLNSATTTLREQYNPLVRRYRDDVTIDDEIGQVALERPAAIASNDENLMTFLTAIKEARNRTTPGTAAARFSQRDLLHRLRREVVANSASTSAS